MARQYNFLVSTHLKRAGFLCLLAWPFLAFQFLQLLVPVSGNLRGKSDNVNGPTTTTNLHSPPTVSHPSAANKAALYELLMKEKDHDATQQEQALVDAGYPAPQVKVIVSMLADPVNGITFTARAENVVVSYQYGLLDYFVARDQNRDGKLSEQECPCLMDQYSTAAVAPPPAPSKCPTASTRVLPYACGRSKSWRREPPRRQFLRLPG
ncbi:unnamed protein product [Amoebophrya sp. A120]|nr:unnamed protein product [Amoebophrya sp. A120]|eukprot:GSA120T00015577001.1